MTISIVAIFSHNHKKIVWEKNDISLQNIHIENVSK